MSLETSLDGSGPITFEDLGIPQRPHTQDTLLGKTRTWSDITKKEIAFLVIALLSLAGALGLTIYNAVWKFKTTEPDFTFAILLIVQICFVAYYIAHGVFGERPYEIAVFVGGCCLLIVYIILNFVSSKGWDDPVKLARLITIGVLGPVDIVLGVFILLRYKNSGNLIFRTVGASADLQDACKRLFFFETLLKLDLQLEVSLLILVLQNGTIIDVLQKVVLGVGFGVSFFWLVLGFVTVRLESKVAMWIFLLTSWLEPGYVIYIIVKAAKNVGSHDHALMLDITTYICSGAALVIRVLVIVWMVRVFKNFGIGLKQKAFNLGYADLPGNNNPNEHTSTTRIYQQEAGPSSAQ